MVGGGWRVVCGVCGVCTTTATTTTEGGGNPHPTITTTPPEHHPTPPPIHHHHSTPPPLTHTPTPPPTHPHPHTYTIHTPPTAPMFTFVIRIKKKHQSGEIGREIERKSGEIGGGFGEIAHVYNLLTIVFVAPDKLESGGKFPFINLKRGQWVCGVRG